MKNTLPYHWEFALASVLAKMEQLVWRFDITAEFVGKAYADVPEPEKLRDIIIGFLSERDWLMEGDISRLEKAEQYLLKHITPVYRLGQEKARQFWQHANSAQHATLVHFTPSDVVAEARSLMPDTISATEQSWFVEGFCRTWWKEEYIAYVLRQAER